MILLLTLYLFLDTNTSTKFLETGEIKRPFKALIYFENFNNIVCFFLVESMKHTRQCGWNVFTFSPCKCWEYHVRVGRKIFLADVLVECGPRLPRGEGSDGSHPSQLDGAGRGMGRRRREKEEEGGSL